jgi:hypothetical protein
MEVERLNLQQSVNPRFMEDLPFTQGPLIAKGCQNLVPIVPLSRGTYRI